MDETLVFYTEKVKTLGDGRVGGYLVRFGDEKTLDLEYDYFDAETDFGIEDGAKIPVYYNHGHDGFIRNRKVGKADVKFDDVGLWVEAQLMLRDDYERAIYELAEQDKLGWSSGAAGHLVERERKGQSIFYITSWPIAEASLTPTPAEPLNNAVPLKSFIGNPKQAEDSGDGDDQNLQVENHTEDDNMDEETLKTLMADVAKDAADNAVKAYIESQEKQEPDITAGYNVEVIEDEADKALKENPFKTGEFFTSVKNATLYPDQIDKRLLPLKATGMNEAIPSQGGFLVQQDVASGILENMWGIGTLLSQFQTIPVSGNGLVMNAIDETSRADGSRGGGVLGYWLEEGGTKTATKPKFRQVDLKLKKVAALCYATDELLDDATALEGWINRYVPGELRFKVEDAIMNGDGVGKPLGILNSGALVQAVRTNANQIAAADVLDMWSLRYPGANDYVWFINQNVIVQLVQMTIGNWPVYIPPGGLSGAQYGSMFGRPVIETEYNPGLGTLGDILLVSPSQYALIDKGGVQAASSIHVQFVTDETAFRFVYRIDGEPEWYEGVTAFNSTDTLSPFVALAATT